MLPPHRDALVRREVRDVTPLARRRQRTRIAEPLRDYRRIAETVLGNSAAPIVELRTSRGPVVLVLDVADAPISALNFLELARRGALDGTRFHRVVPSFVAQGGEPVGAGDGPGYAIRDEFTAWPFNRGALGMARSGYDTGGSQFFLTLQPSPHLDGRYTLFGHVIGGWAAMDALIQGDRLIRAVIR